MQIKPHDGALATTPASVRPQPGSLRPAAGSLHPPDVTQLTGKQAVEGDTVSLSAAVQRLANALREALPELEGTRIAALLTTHDRFVLARALELAQHEQLDPKEVQRLLIDLAAYRANERGAARAERPSERVELSAVLHARGLAARDTSAASIQGRTDAEHAQRRLTLPVFTARDEQLARQILQSQALQDTAIDQGFVRALVDPDRHPTHAVDFAFLRRLVVALSPGQREGLDAQVSLAPRLARANLADAVMRLELRASDLPTATPETLARGRVLLQQSLATRPAPTGGQGERPMFWQLRSSDRALLSLLHVAAEQSQIDPRTLERVTHALVALRWAERGQAASARSLVTSIPPPRSASHAAPSTAPQPRVSYAPSAASSMPRAPDSFAPSASTLEHERELAASLRSRTPSILVPSAPLPPRPSAALGARHSAAPPPRAPEAAHSDSLPPPAARSFGSASQLAARAAGSYGSLAPPPLDPAALAAGSAAERNGPWRTLELGPQGPPQAGSFARPLDISQALGLGALLEQARGRRARAAGGPLSKPQERAVHAVGTAQRPASEAEADDPLLGSSRRERRRVRWQLLIQRRKRKREQHD